MLVQGEAIRDISGVLDAMIPLLDYSFYIEPKKYAKTDEPIGDEVKRAFFSLERELARYHGTCYLHPLGDKIVQVLEECFQNLYQHGRRPLLARFYIQGDRLLGLFQISDEIAEDPNKLEHMAEGLNRMRRYSETHNSAQFARHFSNARSNEHLPLGVPMMLYDPELTDIAIVGLDNVPYFSVMLDLSRMH